MLSLLSKPRRLARPFPKSAARSRASSTLPSARSLDNEELNPVSETVSTISRNRLDRNESPNPQNTSQWVDLLAARYRVYGLKGVEATWWDLRQNGVDLPVQGEREITKLWRDFLEHDGLRNT